MRYEILRVAIAMDLLGIFALVFLEPGTPEFYVDILGIAINTLVIILVLTAGRKRVGR